MSTNRFIARAAVVTAAGLITSGLFSSGIAAAHVTANIYGKPAAKGGYASIVMRVPNEDEKLATTQLRVAVSEDYKFGSVRTKPVPGWTPKIVKTKLDKPITNAYGAEITELVTAVVWTAEKGSEIGPDEYQEFSFSAGPLPEDVDQLVLPSTQVYQKGKVVKWEEEPQEGAELERPAPVVPLASKVEEGAVSQVAESTEEQSAEPAAKADITARWLGGLGLIIGALGLGIGVGSVTRARKQRS